MGHVDPRQTVIRRRYRVSEDPGTGETGQRVVVCRPEHRGVVNLDQHVREGMAEQAADAIERAFGE